MSKFRENLPVLPGLPDSLTSLRIPQWVTRENPGQISPLVMRFRSQLETHDQNHPVERGELEIKGAKKRKTGQRAAGINGERNGFSRPSDHRSSHKAEQKAKKQCDRRLLVGMHKTRCDSLRERGGRGRRGQSSVSQTISCTAPFLRLNPSICKRARTIHASVTFHGPELPGELSSRDDTWHFWTAEQAPFSAAEKIHAS